MSIRSQKRDKGDNSPGLSRGSNYFTHSIKPSTVGRGAAGQVTWLGLLANAGMWVLVGLINLLPMIPAAAAGSVQSWGYNCCGQTNVPAGLTNVIAVDAGVGNHSLALRADGTVVAWGIADQGQCDVPAGLTNVIAIAGGGYHSMALREDGQVIVWGVYYNGIEPFIPAYVPSDLSNVVAIAAGFAHNVALRSDGTVVTWGTAGYTSEPPAGLSNVVAIAAGAAQNLALQQDGTLVTWAGPFSTFFPPPPGLSNITAISACYYNFTALRADGPPVVWGFDNYGQNTLPPSLSNNIVKLEAAVDFILAVTDEGRVVTWGSTNYNQGTLPALPGTVVAVSGGNHILALLEDHPPAIIEQPGSQTLFSGNPVTFAVKVFGSRPLGYQWRFNNTAIPLATNVTYSIPVTTLADSGNYSVVVSNSLDSATSSNALLTVVDSAPIIASHPINQIGYLGRTNSFTVAADGAIPLTYQWRFMATNLPGATNPTLTIAPIKLSVAGDYSVVISNQFGFALSSNASLAVPAVIGWGNATFGQNEPPPDASNIVALSEGAGHSLTLRSDGRVIGWGNNQDGESTLPSPVTNAVKIAAGSHHSLALHPDGTVIAWGNNCCGQTNVPAAATNLVDLAAGTNFSAGLRSDGVVVTWGATVTPPVSNVVAIAAGADHGLALRLDGTVVGWGSNNYAQITVPITATNLVAISAGERHSLALNASGKVFAWGNNSFGQTNIPASVTNIIAIQAGRYHNLALRGDGVLLAWGSNASGERDIPTAATNVMALSAGDGHSAAAIALGGLPQFLGLARSLSAPAGQSVVLNANALGALPFGYQWQLNGTNVAGATNRFLTLANSQAAQAGVYTVIVSNNFGAITGSVASVAITPAAPNIVLSPVSQQKPLGGAATFTIAAVGTEPLQYQWQFQAANIPGATNTSLTVSNLGFATGGSYRAIVSNSVGSTTSVVATLEIMRAYLWGNTGNGKTNVPPAATNLLSMVAGYDHTLALRADGGVVAWGANLSGQTNPPASASNVVMIAAGYDHNLVLRNDGALVAWGNTSNGKTTIPASATNQPLAAIAAGTSHNLVLRTNGSVFAWGINQFATTNVPPRATNVVRIAAAHTVFAGGHNLALRRDGTVVSWGYNTLGQTNPPVAATNLIAVAAGGDFSLALKADGTVVGWGGNGSGQITIPAAASNVVAIAAGNAHSLALCRDGSIVSWGNNGSGQRNLPAVVSNSISVSITAGNQHSGCLLGDGTPVFTDALGDLVAYSNRGFTLNALAAGAPPLSYQWRFNGVDLPAATGGTFTLASVQPTNAGLYSVVVSNALGVNTGLVANLSVEIAPELPSVVVPPQSQTVLAGTNVTFNIVAAGYPAPTYQWQFNNTNLVGATNASHAIPYVLTSQAGNYRVVLSNSVGVFTSQVATLTVNLPDWPAINSWPTNRAVSYGSPLTLTVVPTPSAGPVVYTWQRNGTTLPHVGGPTLVFSAFTPADGGVYRVAVSNQFGGTLSPEFEIAAVPVAVWGSGSVTVLPRALTNAIALSVGAQHAVALKADGRVAAWGENSVVAGSYPSYTTNNYGVATVPAGLSNVVAIAAGNFHSLVVRGDGTVVAWGWPTGGQINVPATATNVIAVAAGDAHSLALRGDGTVIAWGTNNYGQLNVPIEATNIVAIASGNAHCLALRGDGRLVGWGSTFAVQPVPSATNVIAISARANYCIAIKQDGTRLVWGSSTPTQTPFPQFPAGPGSFLTSDHVGAAAGYSHGLFLHAGGAVQALYSIPLSPTDARLTPPNWLVNVIGVAAGNASFALMWPPNGLPVMQVAQRHAYIGNSAVFSTHVEGQQVFNSSSLTGYQWRFSGTNLPSATNSYLVLPSVTAAQAGDYSVVLKDYTGTVTSQVANLVVTPPPLPQIATQPIARTVGAGDNVTFNIALTYGIPGQFQWQLNGVDIPSAINSSLTFSNVQSGNAGDYRVIVTNLSGSITSQVATLTITSTPPQFVVQPQNQSVATGFSTTFSALATGSAPIAYQWQFDGADIPGATTSSLLITNASLAAVGNYRVTATNSNGSNISAQASLTVIPIAAWGNTASAIPASATNLIAIAAGAMNAMVLRSDGTIVTWGGGCAATPANLTNVVRIAAGDLHSVILRDDGTLAIWGDNTAGQLNVPAGLSNLVEISAGATHSLALGADGIVSAWGSSFRGEINVPAGLSNVIAVGAGGMNSLALRRDGTVVGWGALNYVPPQATNVTAIAVGFGHAVALRGDGSVIAWGSTSTSPGLNVSLGCGSYSVGGSLSVQTNLIAIPPTATNIVAIAAGRHHILALRADGIVVAWGDDSFGQSSVPAHDHCIGIAAGGYQSFALPGSSLPVLGGYRTNRSGGESDNLLLNTAVGGMPPLHWQWLTSSTNISGTSRAFLSFPDARVSDSGVKQFVVSNFAGTVTGMITLTVTATPPAMVLQPLSLLVGVGSNVVFTASAVGSLPWNYQWRRNGVDLTDGGPVNGAMTSTLTLQNVQLSDTAAYSLAVTNSVGFTISSNAVLTVFAESPLAEALDTTGFVWSSGGNSGWHWQTNTTHDGGDAAETGPFTTDQTNWLETTVTGPTAVSFWWRAIGWVPDRFSLLIDGVEKIAVANDFEWQQRSCFVPAGPHTLRWSYICQPFAGTSTAWLDQITVTNASAPTITTHPTSRTVTIGSSTTFSSAVSGTEPFAYQWQFNGLDLPNATNPTLTRSGIQTSNAGNYQLIITNIAGAATSSVAVLTVNGSLPILQTGPGSLTAAPGTAPSLNSAFVGSAPMDFQWQLNHADVPSATNLSLVLSNLQPHHAGLYRVMASNELGTAISAEAQVTLVPVAAWGLNTSRQTSVPAWVGDVAGIAAGTAHSVALLRDGSVATWGSFLPSGPLQFPTSSDRFVALAAAGGHSMGLRSNGTVLAFGYVGGGLSSVPADLSNVIAVATGGTHDLALGSEGNVFAWGANESSQANVPASATNLVALAAGRNFSLGVTDAGELMAWGTNSHGQLVVPTSGDFVAVAGGQYHALALRGDGVVVAWGNNASNQANLPVGLSNIVSIAAGDNHSLALRGDGKVFAWGLNTSGQTTVWDTLTNVVAIAGGGSHSLALVGDGRPSITIPPQRRRLETGGNATLRVFASGAGPLAYQWQQEGTNVPGATNATLLVGSVGNYSVTVSNSLGGTVSPPALVVLAPPVLRFDNSPGAMFMAADGLHFRLLGLSGRGPVVVLASADFVSWTPILTNPPVLGQLNLVDQAATNLTQRFYRALESGTVAASLRFVSPSWSSTATGGLFRATLTGLLGSGAITVYGSSNLVNWQSIATNPPVSGDWQFNHLQSVPPTLFWYRAAEQR